MHFMTTFFPSCASSASSACFPFAQSFPFAQRLSRDRLETAVGEYVYKRESMKNRLDHYETTVALDTEHAAQIRSIKPPIHHTWACHLNYVSSLLFEYSRTSLSSLATFSSEGIAYDSPRSPSEYIDIMIMIKSRKS